MPKRDDLELGSLRMAASGAAYTLRLSQLAVDDDHDLLVLVSVVGSQTAVKALTAVLNTNQTAHFYAQQEEITLEPNIHLGRISKAPRAGQYSVKAVRLGYSMMHATAVLKEPGVLPNVSDESLYAELNSPRFTTPLLKEWVSWLRRALLMDKLLKPLVCCQCRVGRLTATDDDLDELVGRGLRSGALTIPGKEVLC